MKTNTQEIVTNRIQELAQMIQDGIECWIKAGQIVVNLLDEQGMTLEEIAEAAASDVLNADVLAQFERIGRNQVLPRLLVSDFPAAKYLQCLPMSEQKRLMDGAVELMVMHGGKPDVLQVNVRHLTRQQCKQAFDQNGVRSAGAQRAWLEERARDKESSAIRTGQHLPWSVKHGKVIFREACEMTRHELAVILTQLA
jgi:hypothetical protein